MSTIIQGIDASIVVYFVALNSFYALLLVLAIPEIWEQNRLAEDEGLERLLQSGAPPPISILVPAHNERATIETSVTAILTLDYQTYEVVVVNDGSSDDTLDRLQEAFDLYRKEEWDMAERRLLKLREASPEAMLCERFVERIAFLRANPPAPGWDGAFTFQTK